MLLVTYMAAVVSNIWAHAKRPMLVALLPTLAVYAVIRVCKCLGCCQRRR